MRAVIVHNLPAGFAAHKDQAKSPVDWHMRMMHYCKFAECQDMFVAEISGFQFGEKQLSHGALIISVAIDIVFADRFKAALYSAV